MVNLEADGVQICANLSRIALVIGVQVPPLGTGHHELNTAVDQG